MEDSSWELDHQEKPLPTVTRNQRAEIQAQQKHEREEGQHGQAQLRANHPRAGSHKAGGRASEPQKTHECYFGTCISQYLPYKNEAEKIKRKTFSII